MRSLKQWLIPDTQMPPLWGLAMLTFSGTLAMHIFVPALPDAGASLAATPAQMQMTISFYIVGLAVGQLIYGPLSDRYGRRKPLLAGLLLYIIASFAALFVDGVHSLIALRLMAAFGGCAGMVLGRVIVRDTTRVAQDVASRLALMNVMVVIGPGLAPLLGGVLVHHLGWRSVFIFLCLLGIANMAYTIFLLPETRQPSVRARSVVRDYISLLRSPVFLGYAVGGGLATTSIYAVVAAAPFVFMEQLHRPASEVGLYLSLVIGAMALGNLLARFLLRRLPLRQVLLGANALSIVSAACMFVACLSMELSVGIFIGPAIVFSIAAGLTSPAAATQVISVQPELSGAASGLYGFGQMMIGAVCTVISGLGADHALLAALTLLVASLVGQYAFRCALA